MSFFVALALITLAQAAPAPLQSLPAEHAPANLDKVLAAKDYRALDRIVRSPNSQAELASDLVWLRDRMMQGSSAFVSMLYAAGLWNASEKLNPDARDDIRQTASVAMLNAYSAITIDGSRCGDGTAVQHRIDQLGPWLPPIWPFMRALPRAYRERLVQLAILTETRTAPQRDAIGDVAFICVAGLEETQYNLAHGTAREVTKDGVGRTVLLQGDGKYKPSEVSEPVAKQKAAAARSVLKDRLDKLVGLENSVP